MMIVRFMLPLVILGLAACGGSAGSVHAAPPVEDFSPDQRPLAKTLVYECAGLEFIARVGPGEMALWVEDRYLVLSQVRSASGVKYVEGDVLFWERAGEAVLEINGQHYQACTLNSARAPWEDARRRNVDFRAVGNEPGWHLEYRQEQNILFVSDYGATRILLQDPVESRDGDGHLITAGKAGDTLRLVIRDGGCTDSMQGTQYPNSAQVEYQGAVYYGCGQHLDHPWE